MKIVCLEAIKSNGSFTKVIFTDDKGVNPDFPNMIDDSGKYVGVGKVSDGAFFYHHIDRNNTRYLIYFNGTIGTLTGREVFDLEKALDVFLSNQQN